MFEKNYSVEVNKKITQIGSGDLEKWLAVRSIQMADPSIRTFYPRIECRNLRPTV